MSPAGTKLAFEVRRFTASPGSPDVAVLELEGRFRAPSRRRLGAPRMLAENAEERIEIGAADGGDATADPEGATWRASFAIPLRLLAGAEFALAVGRELLDLPRPTATRARRRERPARPPRARGQRAARARRRGPRGRGRRPGPRRQRARRARAARGRDARRAPRARRARRPPRAVRDRADCARRGDGAPEAEQGEALAARDAEAEAIADERVAAVEAEAAELRRALKSARADIELLRRERDRAAGRAAPCAPPSPAATPTGRRALEAPRAGRRRPPLPLPEGEDVGPARPAAAPSPATNGVGRRPHGTRTTPDDEHATAPA